ncbi:MAG: HAD family hydrolase [Acidimicrobiales bacterium]
MTDAPDEGRAGERPAPEPPEPAGPPQPPASSMEPPGPELDESTVGTGEGEAPLEPPSPKRRRSRNRGRHRRKAEAGPQSEAAGANDATDQDVAGQESAGDGHQDGLVRVVERPVPATYGPLQAAFFDLDKTVIAKASMVAFGRPFYHGGLINRRTVLRALYGELVYLHLGASEQRLNRIRESVLRLIKGWHRDRVCEIVAEAIEAIVEPIIFAEAADLIDWHHEQGRLVVIVSASPDEIVAPLSRFLGADACIASRARVDDQGRYTGSMQFYAFGPFKAEAMDALAAERGIDLAASYAYTDSYTDLPMLVAVGHPVAVNPDRVLNRYAREHDFEVLHFGQTVSLWSRARDRIGTVPQRPAIAVSAGAVALGVGAAAAGWWLGSRRHDS